jgi:predicted MPP superfamily phosphohydrolase
MNKMSLFSKRRVINLLQLLFITLAGTLIGVALFGHGKAAVGPLQTVLSLQPTFSGGTLIELGPLGEISFASHSGLVGVKIEVKSMTPGLATDLVVSNNKIDKLKNSVADNLRSRFIHVAIKASIAGAIFSFLFMLLTFRSFKRSIISFILSLVISGAVAVSAYLSYQPQAIMQPVYRGLVQAAPTLIGSAKDIADNFDKYRDQMAGLLSNVTALYNAGENLQDYSLPDDSIKVLHISDLHLNPQGWDMVKLLTKNFKVSVIVDTGDITDHGTAAEDPYLAEIGKLKVPYIYVRGNHDSMHTQEVISNFPNAHVLDNSAILINGLTFAGVGDPRFTPDKSKESAEINDLDVAATARFFANYLRGALTGQPIKPDLILVHDPAMAKELLSLSPLILAGHLHHRSSRFLDETTQLMVQGSTGGSGLRALTDGKADSLEATILHFDSVTKKLIAWNNITMSGLGYADVKISRHLPSSNTFTEKNN